MLDLSEYKESPESQAFDAYEEFMELCNDYNLPFEGDTVFYPIGWRVLVMGFINDVKNYSVTITEVESSWGLLEIRFEMKSDQNEAQVWRLAESARLESRQTCMECGNLTSLIHVPHLRKRICRDCSKRDKGSTNTLTGTWLDKY